MHRLYVLYRPFPHETTNELNNNNKKHTSEECAATSSKLHFAKHFSIEIAKTFRMAFSLAKSIYQPPNCADIRYTYIYQRMPIENFLPRSKTNFSHRIHKCDAIFSFILFLCSDLSISFYLLLPLILSHSLPLSTSQSLSFSLSLALSLSLSLSPSLQLILDVTV